MTKLYRTISSVNISKWLYFTNRFCIDWFRSWLWKIILIHIILAFVILIFGIYLIENKFLLKIEYIKLLIKKNKIFLFWFIWTVLSFSGQ